MVDRGRLGTLPLATERDDESYIDFVEGVRTYTLTKVSPVVRERGAVAIEAFKTSAGRDVSTEQEVKQTLDPIAVVATRNRYMRSAQEMMWRQIAETYRKREPELLAELDRYDRSGPGSVEWDPNFQYPAYFDSVEFHIQPGNYHADPLAGYIYHYGTKVFYTGRNNNDDVQRDWMRGCPMPKDGVVRRVMDQGCSAGQSTTAWKERLPNAEVHGIDIGAPMVRYAHKRAVDMNLDVHFKQMAVEDLKYPDNSFDIVYARILFHELPEDIAAKAVREAFRVLRPGGVYCVVDFANRPGVTGTPIEAYHRFYDSRDNGEPYASAFVYSDFTGMLRRTGFSEVHENFDPTSYQPMRVCFK